MLKSIAWYGQYIFSVHWLRTFRFDLRRQQPHAHENPALLIKLLDTDLVDTLAEFHDTRCRPSWGFLFDRPEIRRRLDNGHVCYLAIVDGRIVGFCWFGPTMTYCSETMCWFAVGPAAIISYNLFIDESHRGRNISPAIRDRAFRDFSLKNFRECYNYVSTRNRSNLRSVKKHGAAPSGRICYGYFLGFRYLFALGQKGGLTILKKPGALGVYQKAADKLVHRTGGRTG